MHVKSGRELVITKPPCRTHLHGLIQPHTGTTTGRELQVLIHFNSSCYSYNADIVLQPRLGQSLRVGNARLNSRSGRNTVVPGLQVEELAEVDADTGRVVYPAKDLDVDDAVGAQEELAALEALLDHAIQPLRLVDVAGDAVRARNAR